MHSLKDFEIEHLFERNWHVFRKGILSLPLASQAAFLLYLDLKSLNLREGQPRPGTGFGPSPLFWGMMWVHSALFSFKV